MVEYQNLILLLPTGSLFQLFSDSSSKVMNEMNKKLHFYLNESVMVTVEHLCADALHI